MSTFEPQPVNTPLESIDWALHEHFQPSLNVGTIGSVSNGKSSIVKGETGTTTLRDSREQKQSRTIRLGYANAKIYKCPNCPEPVAYQTSPSNVFTLICKHCGSSTVLQLHISFCDTPGHHTLMATMMNGACVMDTSILVEAANSPTFPAPQTKEHLQVANLVRFPNSIVCMNKMDLIKPSIAQTKINELQSALQNTVAAKSPIIPVAANYELNLDVLNQYLCTLVPKPERQLETDVKMIVIRSFNVNRQDTPIKDLQGGVIGGTIIQGVLRVGQRVCVLPGIAIKNPPDDTNPDAPEWQYQPLVSIVESIKSEENNIYFARPGGLLGIQLRIDPALTAQDKLVGSILTPYTENNLARYHIYESLLVQPELLDGQTITNGDQLVLNHNASNIRCEVMRIHKKTRQTELKLTKPLCVQTGDCITLSRKTRDVTTLLGRAPIIDGFASRRYN